ncbi:MAG: ATP-binding cassette domain-containing protein [Clostridia bacterium]|nr:ATP-binding cassette domain-containing protein [Clostridia bacterium]
MGYIEAEGLGRSFLRRERARSGGISRLWRRETQLIRALEDVSFSIERGELVGIIGPNGAGKSTTVKLMTGILTPSAGTCRIDGRVPWEDRRAHVRHLGAVFGQRTQLWWDVPILDSFELLRDVYSLREPAFRARLEELVEGLDLSGFLRTPLRQLSLGQRMRAELCGSLLHEPELLFLDEPTIGLDAVSKLRLRAFLKEENRRRGTTILLTTHDMEDMLALCSRVLVLGRGRLLYDGGLDALLRRYDTVHTLRCSFDGEASFRLPEGVTLEEAADGFTLTYAPAQAPTSQVIAAVLAAGKLREMTLKEQNVDELIARMYQEMAL